MVPTSRVSAMLEGAGLVLTCVRVRLRPRGLSDGSAEGAGADEGGSEPAAN